MEISGAQLNNAVLDAVSAQGRPAVQESRQAPAPQPNQASAEVSLSRDARERAAQAQNAQPIPTPQAGQNPVESVSTRSEPVRESRSTQAGENESRPKQPAPAVQAQNNAPTYTAKVAEQNYTRVSDL